jgi:hypothetical protein
MASCRSGQTLELAVLTHRTANGRFRVILTCSTLAVLTGRKRQRIQQMLSHVPPSTQTSQGGRLVPGFYFANLPEILQSELVALAARRGFITAKCQGFAAVQALLAAAPAQWQPRVPIAQASQAALDKAAKLRTVLEPFLRGEALDTRTSAERNAAGVEAYRQEFGFPISAKTFQKWFDRVRERDGGRADWMRLELYLDDNATAAPRTAASDRTSHAAHEAALGDMIRTLDNAAQPTLRDKKFVFDAAFRHLETDRVKKSTLIDWLFQAVPALAATRAALKCMFNRKLRVWTGADQRRRRRPRR